MEKTHNKRWRTSLHEASHAVVTICLGGRCSGAMLTVDGGLANFDDLLGDRFAFAVAAGPEGEKLAERYDTPQSDFPSIEDLANTPMPNADPEFWALATCVDMPEILDKYPSDDRLIAEWAIQGREGDPESWAGMVSYAKRVANDIVTKNESNIVRVANSLYERGRLTGDQIKNLIGGKIDG